MAKQEGKGQPIAPISAKNTEVRSTQGSFYSEPSLRQALYDVSQKIADHVHSNKSHAVIFLDSGARLISTGMREFYTRRYPNERIPNSYFVNPNALRTKDDVAQDLEAWIQRVSSVEVPDIQLPHMEFPDSLRAERIKTASSEQIYYDSLVFFTRRIGLDSHFRGKTLEECDQILKNPDALTTAILGPNPDPARLQKGQAVVTRLVGLLSKMKEKIYEERAILADSREASDIPQIIQEFADTFTGIMRVDKNAKITIVDTCIHEGRVLRPTLRTFHDLGFTDIDVVVISDERNFSGIKPTMVTREQQIGGTCYPFGKDNGLKKPYIIPHVEVTGSPKQRERGWARRDEIRTIIASEYAHKFLS